MDAAAEAPSEDGIPQVMAAMAAALREADDPDLHRQLAGMLFVDDQFDDCRRHFELAFRGYRDRGMGAEAAHQAIFLADLHLSALGNEAASRGWLERARRLLDQVGPCVEWGYLELALLSCGRTDIDDLLASATRALDIAHAYGDRGLEARALADLGLAHVTAGRAEEGFRYLDEALAVVSSGEVETVTEVGLTLCALLSSCNRAGDLRRAEESIDLVRATVLTPLHGRPRVLHAQCLISYAAVLHKVGRWAEAEAAVTEALSDTGSRFQAHRVDALCLLAELRIEQGRVEEAAALVEPHADDITVAAAMARVHLCRGDSDEAAALLRRALRMLRGDEVRAEPLAVLLVEAELARGDVDAARAAAASLDGGLALVSGGRIAAACEEWTAATEALATAATSAEAGRRPALAATIRVELAEAEAAVGDRAEAAVDARIALRAFEGLGSTPGADRARAVLRSLGVREAGGRRADPSTAGLSARELSDVLALLRAGLSNAEIGARLFISAKTVEHHVGHILAKLGVRSRGEAAAVANRGFE